MGMLADQVDHVIGVDTHRDAHTAAIVAVATGAVIDTNSIPSDAFGNKRLLRFAKLHAGGRRVWAIESSGSYGSGLTTFLLEHGERVVEIDRPSRPASRNGAKSDELDAVRAAREALARDHLAQPRCRGDREALRVLLITRRGAIRARTKAINHLKALVVTSREEIRHQLRRHETNDLINRCARMRTLPTQVSRASIDDHGAAVHRPTDPVARAALHSRSQPQRTYGFLQTRPHGSPAAQPAALEPPGELRAAPLPLQCWVPPVRAPGQDSHLRSHTSCPAYLRSPSGLAPRHAGAVIRVLVLVQPA